MTALVSNVLLFVRALRKIRHDRAVGGNHFRWTEGAERNILPVEFRHDAAVQDWIEFNPEIFRFDLHVGRCYRLPHEECRNPNEQNSNWPPEAYHATFLLNRKV